MLAPKGRNDPVLPWATARISHHKANALNAATTATDLRLGLVNRSAITTTSDTDSTRVASAE
jgi:hypothetical protein